MDIKNFTYGEGRQGALSIQKIEKITRTEMKKSQVQYPF